jgi:hypothetical protein
MPLPASTLLPDLGFAMRRLCLALLLLAAACQPLPHPFAEDTTLPDPTALRPPDSAGIIVLPVTGAPSPMAERLAEAMAKALRGADVPASTTAQNRGSYRLVASAEEKPLGPGRSSVTVAWRLEDAGGAPIGQHAETAETASAIWQQGDSPLAANLANEAAPAIAALVEGDAPLPTVTVEPVLAVRGISGAPGDGGETLSRAIGNALQRANVEVAARPNAKARFVLTGRVEVSPPDAGKQKVKVSWLLAQPDGHQIGMVNQENAVPAGSLDGAWGDVAFAVAAAAAPGIATLIEHAKIASTGG